MPFDSTSEVMELIHAESKVDLADVRTLFLEYAGSLSFGLGFQDFDAEVSSLPGEYIPPSGRLILCRIEGRPAGCIALRRIDSTVCEMKRLYVRPEFRGRALGYKLVERLIKEARIAGYRLMRLDTVAPAMPHAIALYRSFGFREIPAYYDNPIPGAMFMELDLESPV
jgi:putative acetyltransferase